ncbi:hypothetical protein [Flagellimonas allohymeniacidonis]|uniref:Tetratricopeptide repeat protein n=1 Tax=Flagellimonas allohymeniacidonis TaxID=2517819 RepID=A0A4Q8QGJ6_9FLAO|nr:hypothetical protein [Allomuricauda hymeniacidonis]TAI47499.1 hypothetical protein EW142_12580 [Allomuricauda hymeniacidonis]
MLILLLPVALWAQEEESAEVFLEDYTDEFQEAFFEALKQKGIQNYDRATSYFFQCKRLDSSKSVVDYELARTFFLDKKYPQAQQYAIMALNAEPSNYWYLENLVTILDNQGGNINNLQGSVPVIQGELRENLARVYFYKRKYEEALQTLEGLGNNSSVESLRKKINDSIRSLQRNHTERIKPKQEEEIANDPVTNYSSQIEKLILGSEFNTLEKVAKEALDNYPLQPYFHYAYGLSLGRTSREKQAIEVLEAGLDFILDNTVLRNKMYQELAKAHANLGDNEKSKEYLNKIEPRS